MYCIFWACHVVTKSACSLHHARRNACISTDPAGRISHRLEIGDFYEYLSRNSRFPDSVKIRYFAQRPESLIYILAGDIKPP